MKDPKPREVWWTPVELLKDPTVTQPHPLLVVSKAGYTRYAGMVHVTSMTSTPEPEWDPVPAIMESGKLKDSSTVVIPTLVYTFHPDELTQRVGLLDKATYRVVLARLIQALDVGALQAG